MVDVKVEELEATLSAVRSHGDWAFEQLHKRDVTLARLRVSVSRFIDAFKGNTDVIETPEWRELLHVYTKGLELVPEDTESGSSRSNIDKEELQALESQIATYSKLVSDLEKENKRLKRKLAAGKGAKV